MRERLGEPANRLRTDLHWGAAVTVNMTNSNEFLWGITPVFAHVTVVPRATVIAAG